MRLRKAIPADMDAIYLMGRDPWGKGQARAAYLKGCRDSRKYRRGEWLLLEDAKRGPLASLIVYPLAGGAAGLGSIAVAPENRGKGLASELIRRAVKALSRSGARRLFLFSDIRPGFYERFGFSALPVKHQKYPKSVCMARARRGDRFLSVRGFRPPRYF